MKKLEATKSPWQQLKSESLYIQFLNFLCVSKKYQSEDDDGSSAHLIREWLMAIIRLNLNSSQSRAKDHYQVDFDRSSRRSNKHHQKAVKSNCSVLTLILIPVKCKMTIHSSQIFPLSTDTRACLFALKCVKKTTQVKWIDSCIISDS